MRQNKGVPPQAGSGHSGFAPSPKGLGHSESVPNANGIFPEPWRENLLEAEREFRRSASRMNSCCFQRHIPCYRDADLLGVIDETLVLLFRVRDRAAQAIEARRAIDAEGGVVADESAVPKGCAQ